MDYILWILFIPFVLFGLLLYFDQKYDNPSEFLPQEDTRLINYEKHACKCYMEKLTDGEKKVADILAKELNYKDYFLFNNIIINSKKNISTQIDHIIVSKFGIFVVESKDFSGWILGNNNQDYWTQSFPRGKRFKFKNPVKQNYGHIFALKELMPFVKDNFYNLVVFTGEAEIKTGPIAHVVYLKDMIDHIKKLKNIVLSDNEVQFAVGKLSYACQTINISHDEHVANIHAHVNIKPQFEREVFRSYYSG